MARLKRLVLPGIAHHVTQRGNRRETVFFGEADYAAYLELLGQYAQKSGTGILAYCLMPNHVHLIAIPAHEDGLRAMLGETHRRYTARINARNKWTGHLWQGRFGSVAMDDTHIAYGLRYVMDNPVRAKLVHHAASWRWSSARAYLKGETDPLLDMEKVALWRESVRDLRADEQHHFDALRKAETIGRPVGAPDWLEQLERQSGLQLAPKKRGPKGRSQFR